MSATTSHRCRHRASTGRAQRFGLSVAALAVAGAMLPLGVSAAQASGTQLPTTARAAAAKPGFSGYSTTAAGSPIKVEIYEPTIPIPATPQAELSVGYSAIVADSSSARSRSSYLWPGAPVGEGFKTIIENLGLPPEIADPLGSAGYPIQVNAVYPGGPEEQRDEPLPGSIQRASAKENEAYAANGFSSDSEPKDDDETPGGGGLPLPIPGLEGLEDVGGLGGLGGILGSLGQSRGSAAAPSAPSAAPGLPPELAALLDVGGFSSVSKSLSGDTAFSQSRASVTDVTLLGGLVTIEGVKTIAKTKSDGTKGVAEGEADYGDIIAFGQRFKFGPDGYEAVGQGGPIPGLPDQATKALEQLGLKIIVPKASYDVDGDAAGATVPGLIIDFDLTTLKSQLSALPLNDIIDLIPAQAGQLKSLLQAAANASPRIVFTLGLSASTVDTSQPPPPPPPVDPTTEPTEDPTDDAVAPPPSGGGDTGSTGTTSDPVLPPSDPGPDTSGDLPVETASPPLASSQPGLPGLFTIPTLLTLLGVGLAVGLGYLTRRMGLAALGGTTSCSHGLASGLPDLRKVQ